MNGGLKREKKKKYGCPNNAVLSEENLRDWHKQIFQSEHTG